MAIRVRKLARQLRRSPDELLEWLHALGFERYRSPDDMLPEHAAQACRDAAKRAGPPRPVRVSRPPAPRVRDPASDGMGAIVPDVTPLERDVPGRLPRHPPASPATAGADAPSVASEREALRRARAEVEADRARVAELRARLEAAEARLAEERAAVEHERSRLREERRALDAHRPEEASQLTWLLTERGLRGVDEMERALAALAERRQLRHVIEVLRCDDPIRVADLLQQRLVLVGGEIPDALPETLAAVQVAPSRADVPGQLQLDRALARFGEILLLYGLRRVAVVGGRPQWHKVLREGLDPRVDLSFPPPPPRDPEDAREDVARADLVVLWDVSEEHAAGYGAGRAVVVPVSGDHLLSLVTGVEEFLRRGAA